MTALNPSPVDIVSRLLANTSDPVIVRELVAPNATYISLAYSNPDLKRIMPWAGTHNGAGPEAVIETFGRVGQFWTNEDFKVHAIFGEDEHVAVFGQFTYRSTVLGKRYTSTMAIWCRVVESKVVFMQFMEDSFGTAATFQKSGKAVYQADPKGGEVIIEI